MRLRIKLTYPKRQRLEVEASVSGDDIEFIDKKRATCSGGEIIINRSFGKGNVVPDVDRYRFHFDEEQFVLCPHTKCTVSRCSNQYYDIAIARAQRDHDKTLVILLESPHRDEYLRNVGRPIAPAQGTTGRRLHRYLGEVLRSCPSLHCSLRTGTTRVILSNPIQFQASLVAILGSKERPEENKKIRKKRVKKNREAVRDAVWKALWNYTHDNTSEECREQSANVSFPIRDCFRNRLEKYDPNYIINACTSSTKDMKEMKKCLNNFLKCHFGTCKRYEVNHPSFWQIESNRKLSLLS